MCFGKVALYTTVYPGCEKYLPAWHQSVLQQTNHAFDLWIGVDSLDKKQVIKAIGAEPKAHWYLADKGLSPTQIRQHAIEQMAVKYPAIVFTDCDDVLANTRVAAARARLVDYDVVACRLEVINEQGEKLGIVFGPSSKEITVGLFLPYQNIFGLSNTAYRSEILQQCLPFPDECVLLDWLLATRAWTLGATFYFDMIPHMLYRQYTLNLAPILPPFTPEKILQATERVLHHYHCLLSANWTMAELYYAKIVAAMYKAVLFNEAVRNSAVILHKYIQALNELAPQHVWWWSVAHPELEYIWNP